VRHCEQNLPGRISYVVPFIICVVCGIAASGCKDSTFGDLLLPPEVPADIAPAWSPNGKWIAYHHEDYTFSDSTYPNGLYIVDTNGNNRRLLVSGSARFADWSPDSRYIAFCSSAVYVVNLAGDSVQRMTSFAGTFPSWSPDETRIACGRSGPQDTVGIWIVDVSTLAATRFGYGGALDWSPDGNKFVYAGAMSPYTTGITIVSVSNPSDKKVLREDGQYDNQFPKWSADGKLIVWCINYSIYREVWIMNSDGSGQRKLTDGYYPAWRPDSKAVIFSGWNESKSKRVLWKVNVDGSGPMMLTR
jgi:TolB protein